MVDGSCRTVQVATLSLEVQLTMNKEFGRETEKRKTDMPNQCCSPSSISPITGLPTEIRTAKAERRYYEKLKAEGQVSPDINQEDGLDKGLSPAEIRAKEAEKRAAWRAAR